MLDIQAIEDLYALGFKAVASTPQELARESEARFAMVARVMLAWPEIRDEISRLRDEQRRDLADVERFRGMARKYMDELDEWKKLGEFADVRRAVESLRWAEDALDPENLRRAVMEGKLKPP